MPYRGGAGNAAPAGAVGTAGGLGGGVGNRPARGRCRDYDGLLLFYYLFSCY